MNKIDKNLLNFAILSKNDCNIDAIVYYLNKEKTQDFFIKNNIKIKKELPFINAFAVCFTNQNLFKVAKQNFISYITSISTAFTMIDVSKKIINANNLKSMGEGITIAFVDTGISSHLDFKLCNNRIIKFVDFINGKEKNYDDNGHGTFVASVASGNGIVSNGKYSGIAPKSNIISLKALDKNGEANAVQILDAMQWIYDNYKKYNIKVVCMSFGSEPLGAGDPIMKGAEKLWNEGIVVVCAGGNSGPNLNTIKSPGISKKIITVGGLDDKRDENGNYNEKDFCVADFSSRGPAFGKIKPDIIAPSVNITCSSHLGGYKQMSGTSVATPIVAGICAVIHSEYKNISPDQIKKFLLYNAKNIHKSKYEQGYGLINVLGL